MAAGGVVIAIGTFLPWQTYTALHIDQRVETLWSLGLGAPMLAVGLALTGDAMLMRSGIGSRWLPSIGLLLGVTAILLVVYAATLADSTIATIQSLRSSNPLAAEIYRSTRAHLDFGVAITGSGAIVAVLGSLLAFRPKPRSQPRQQ